MNRSDINRILKPYRKQERGEFVRLCETCGIQCNGWFCNKCDPRASRPKCKCGNDVKKGKDKCSKCDVPQRCGCGNIAKKGKQKCTKCSKGLTAPCLQIDKYTEKAKLRFEAEVSKGWYPNGKQNDQT